MAVVNVPGVRLRLHGPAGPVELVVPPIPLGALQQMHERIGTVRADLSPESIATIIDATHVALRRNYPELTREQVGELVDVGNMLDVFGAVMDVSGLRRKAQEAEAAPGEALAPASTGASSTPT